MGICSLISMRIWIIANRPYHHSAPFLLTQTLHQLRDVGLRAYLAICIRNLFDIELVLFQTIERIDA